MVSVNSIMFHAHSDKLAAGSAIASPPAIGVASSCHPVNWDTNAPGGTAGAFPSLGRLVRPLQVEGIEKPQSARIAGRRDAPNPQEEQANNLSGSVREQPGRKPSPFVPFREIRLGICPNPAGRLDHLRGWNE